MLENKGSTDAALDDSDGDDEKDIIEGLKEVSPDKSCHGSDRDNDIGSIEPIASLAEDPLRLNFSQLNMYGTDQFDVNPFEDTTNDIYLPPGGGLF